MSRINFDNVASQQHAATHNWNLLIQNLPTAVNSEVPKIYVGTNGILNFTCESAGLPGGTTIKADGKIRGHVITQAIGFEPEGELTLTFFENNSHQISKFFEIWRAKSINRQTGTQAVKSDYVLSNGWKMELLNGLGETSMYYEAQEVFIVDVRPPEPTGDPDLVRVEVTISYANFKTYDENGDEII